MRQRKLRLQGTAIMGTVGDTRFNILDYVKDPVKATRGLEAVDEAYHRLQREIYINIVLPTYDDVEMPDNPPSEEWARTAGATGAMIYFPTGKYRWEGTPQLWPKTGIVGDGYFSTVFEYGGEVLNKERPEALPHWHLSAQGDPALLVVGDCSIMGTEFKGMNHGIRDIRFVPGQGGRDNTGIILAGALMNQQIRDVNIMQHSGEGEAFVGIGSLQVTGRWTPKSINGIYNYVKIKGGTGSYPYHGTVNDLVIENAQIEKARAGLWLTSVVFGNVTNCRFYHGQVGEIYTSCHDLRVANMATHCDLAGYYNKAMHVSTVVGDKCRVGVAYKAQSRDDRDERLDLRFWGSGDAMEKQRVAVGSEFDEDLGIWKAGDRVAGT